MTDITQDKMEAAMTFLAETDSSFATAKTNLERMDILRKRVRQRIFLTEEGSVALREAKADTHEDVIAADDNYIAALLAYEKLKAQRQRAESVKDVWRTIEASRRRA
jgi:hypothetical protein